MHFQDKGIIISKHPLKESSHIISVLTDSHGIYSAVVRSSKKNAGLVYQPGNLVDFFWNARLHEHIGFARCDLLKSYGSLLMHDKMKLYAFNSVVGLLKVCFIEREPHNNFFVYFKEYLERLVNKFCWKEYIKLELQIISETGHSLDLSRCTVTKQTHDLCFVSPKSGKAVSKLAGMPHADKLLPLPEFLLTEEQNRPLRKLATAKEMAGDLGTQNRNVLDVHEDSSTKSTPQFLAEVEFLKSSSIEPHNNIEINKAFTLTSYFLRRYLMTDKNEPEARKRLIATQSCS